MSNEANKQPEALRLAEAWENKLSAYGHSELASASSAELVRQHALIAELMKVLQSVNAFHARYCDRVGLGEEWARKIERDVRNAISKAKES